ncbi:MAG: RNA polymerase sigma factor [Chloroflexota bacterium]|nr:RNA polymerase sigma factor [Chloroflexota bacterium]
MEGLALAIDEKSWITRAREGDQAAFEAIYNRYERRIYAFVYRLMGNSEDAYDLTQDTFIKAYGALPRTAPDLNLSAWLHRIASNACMDVLRRRKLIRWLPWETFDTNPALEPIAVDDPVGEYNQVETSGEVQEILNKLTPKHKMSLVLKEYQGMSCDEIGQVMGLSRSAVKSLLFRAREEFRQAYLTKYGRSPMMEIEEGASGSEAGA